MNEYCNYRAVAAMIASMGLFVLNNAVMKMATTAMPVSEAVAVRGAVAGPLILAVVWARGERRSLRCALAPMVLLRGGFDALNAMMFLAALTLMTLADDVAIQQIVPLLMTGYAAVVLRERFGWLRLCAIALGFCGALLVANPTGHGLGIGAALAFGATIAVAGRDLSTRHIDKAIPPVVMTFSATIVLTLVALVFGIFDRWVLPNAAAVPLLALAAVLITSALVTITLAFRWGQVQAVAPFYYTQTFFAVMASFVLFGDAPKPLALLGMALVVTAGLVVLSVTTSSRPVALPVPRPPPRGFPRALASDGSRLVR